MPALGAIRHTLWFKLTAAFLLVAAAGIIIVSLLANFATTAGFRRYLNQDLADQWADLRLQLERHYEREGSWEGVEPLLSAAAPAAGAEAGGGAGGQGVGAGQGQGAGPGQGAGAGQGGTNVALWDGAGELVAAAGGRRNLPAGPQDADVSLPLIVAGEQVGTLTVRQPGRGAGEQFLAGVNNAILWGGLAAVLLALLLGAFLARRLTLPLRRLTEATHRVAQGQLGRQVSTDARGEIGELSDSFNQMSAALAASEQQRRQMLADVAHELRTPLSISRGHIEAMLDGVFEMTPDNLALVHEETLLLGRLVDDLRTLSLAEAGQLSLERAPLNLNELSMQAVAAFEPLAEAEGIGLKAELPDLAPLMSADPNRIRQVLGNLLSNALRHVKEAGNTDPRVVLSVSAHGDEAWLAVSDNGPGLSPEARQHVFDRFWRADGARSRDQGGSGLGLAICRAIVEAHGGRIWVEGSPGAGSTFIVSLPAGLPRPE